MLRYLYDHAHVRRVLVEFGPAESYLMQRYIETGDEKWVEDSWYYKMPEYKLLLRELYAFNSRAKEKIELVGVDFDSDHLFAKAIDALKPVNKEVPESIRPMMDSVAANKNRVSKYTARVFIDSFQADFRRKRNVYSDYFGAAYDQVATFADNDASYVKFNDRDNQMASNFVLQYDGDTVKNYFGMFGWSHAYRNSPASFISIVTNNEEELPEFYGKALCCGMAYDSCHFMYREEIFISPGEAIDYVGKKDSKAILDIFRKQATCEVTLFDIRYSGNPLIQAANSQFDLMFYVRKSKACAFAK
jgi:hypothetical protein